MFDWKTEDFISEAARKCSGKKKHVMKMLGMFIGKNGGYMVAECLKVVKLNICFKYNLP